jgi:osmotically-inducible protein OsmY
MYETRIGMVLGACGLLMVTGCGSADTALKNDPNAVKAVDDGALLVAAKAELAKNELTKPYDFDVSVKDGVVTLTGTGPLNAKAEAERIVKVAGVSKVVNQIVVRKN